MEMNRIFRQTLRPISARHFAAENRADDAVGIANIELGFDFFLALQRRRRQIEQHLIIERILQTMILRDLAVAADFRANFRLIENRRVVQPLRFPVFDRAAHFDACPSDRPFH